MASLEAHMPLPRTPCFFLILLVACVPALAQETPATAPATLPTGPAPLPTADEVQILLEDQPQGDRGA